MSKYVALLRGINVGGNSKVPMPKLKNAFETIGLENVSTYINSGNVLFDTNKKESVLVSEIEKLLKKTFGFSIRIILRSAKNIAEVCSSIPKDWQNNDNQKTDVLFLWDEYADKRSLSLIKANDDVDNLKYATGAIIWNIDRKQRDKSGMIKFIGSELYKNMTARNVNTVRKLNALLAQSDSI
jgi:uncharacterized protein (DUF1697 family)